MKKLNFEIFKDEENQWGLSVDNKIVYCGDMLSYVDDFLRDE